LPGAHSPAGRPLPGMGYGVADTGVDFDFVTPQEAHALLKSDKAIFVDARDPDDFKISKLQTSYSFPANDIMFRPDKLDKELVPRCKALAEAGKLVICVSDAGISGMQNRGHVSRCRHIAQYIHELGVPRESIRRLQGGLNAWKRSGLDGIFGDTRLYYAGAVLSVEKAMEVDRLIAAADGADVEAARAAVAAAAIGDAPAAADDAEAPTSAKVALAVEAGVVADLPPPTVVATPTVYRVLRGEVYKKSAPEAEKILKLDWAVDRLVRTTGEIFVGASGGVWAELDTAAGEKKGWVYVKGPGFGPSTRKIITEYLSA